MIKDIFTASGIIYTIALTVLFTTEKTAATSRSRRASFLYISLFILIICKLILSSLDKIRVTNYNKKSLLQLEVSFYESLYRHPKKFRSEFRFKNH